MKVFACRNQHQYGGGLVLVAANTKEEAYLTAAMDDNLSYLFDWSDDNFPISRVYRDNNTVRVYALDSKGGIAIISYKNKRFQILTLGEDDAWHFLNSRRIYEDYCGSKQSFVYLLSEALSLFNNIEL